MGNPLVGFRVESSLLEAFKELASGFGYTHNAYLQAIIAQVVATKVDVLTGASGKMSTPMISSVNSNGGNSAVLAGVLTSDNSKDANSASADVNSALAAVNIASADVNSKVLADIDNTRAQACDSGFAPKSSLDACDAEVDRLVLDNDRCNAALSQHIQLLSDCERSNTMLHAEVDLLLVTQDRLSFDNQVMAELSSKHLAKAHKLQLILESELAVVVDEKTTELTEALLAYDAECDRLTREKLDVVADVGRLQADCERRDNAIDSLQALGTNLLLERETLLTESLAEIQSVQAQGIENINRVRDIALGIIQAKDAEATSWEQLSRTRRGENILVRMELDRVSAELVECSNSCENKIKQLTQEVLALNKQLDLANGEMQSSKVTEPKKGGAFTFQDLADGLNAFKAQGKSSTYISGVASFLKFLQVGIANQPVGNSQ